jgi:hypothetical protein
MVQSSSNARLKRLLTFLGMILGTGLCGLIIGGIATFIGIAILSDGVAGFGKLVGAIAGIVLGYPIGVIAGILVISRLLHYAGSPRLGIVCALLGWVLVIALARPFNVLDDPNLIFTLVLIVPPLFGTIGFHIISFFRK